MIRSNVESGENDGMANNETSISACGILRRQNDA